MSHCNTPEQTAIIGWSGHRLVFTALAGPGKTSTLLRFAQASSNCTMLYLACNRAVRDEAEGKFPFIVECRPLARTSITTFNGLFCNGDSELGLQHFLDKDSRCGLSPDKILVLAQLLWCESARQGATSLVSHDVYLNLYQLSRPDLFKRWKTLMFNEEQGVSAVTQSLVLAQCCDVVLVDDGHQQIYQFSGEENVLDAPELVDAVQLYLNHSFRFDPTVTQVVNMLLSRQEETIQLVGEERNAKVMTCTPDDVKGQPVAILSQTVAGVIGAALDASLAGKTVYWVGGIAGYKTEELEDLYWFSADMTERMQSPRLAREYRNFEEFESVARATRDVEMNQGLRLLEQYFPLPQKLQVMREHAVTDESQAQVIVSTAHRSKGLEWPVVILNEDFADITDPLMAESERTDETNLLYVAVTRARQMLILNELLQMLMDSESNDLAGGLAC